MKVITITGSVCVPFTIRPLSNRGGWLQYKYLLAAITAWHHLWTNPNSNVILFATRIFFFKTNLFLIPKRSILKHSRATTNLLPLLRNSQINGVYRTEDSKRSSDRKTNLLQERNGKIDWTNHNNNLLMWANFGATRRSGYKSYEH